MKLEVGKKINYWTLIEKRTDERHKAYWICRCTCGYEKLIRDDVIKQGHAVYCGNLERHPEKSKIEDLAGKNFGEWEVLQFDHKDERNRPYWLCRCSCGIEKIVRGDTLKSGKSTSCHILSRHNKQVKKGKTSFYDWAINDDWGKQLLKEARFNTKEFSYGSNKEVLWECEDGHQWYAKIMNRRYNKTKCPECSNLKQSERTRNAKIKQGINDVETWCKNNGEWGKQLLNEYTGYNNKGNKIDLKYIGIGSKEILRWKCKSNENHIWDAYIYNRTACKSGCPYCNGYIVDKGRNDLLTWCESNGVQGNIIRSEWIGKGINGEIVEIDDIQYASSLDLLWKCKNGHIYINKISDRTCKGQNCPYCSTYGTSYPEQVIYYCMLQIWGDVLNRHRVNKSDEHPQGIEFDIIIPQKRVCIEYSSEYWHQGKEEMEEYKRQLCRESNARLIEIIETQQITEEYVIENENRFLINNKNKDMAIKKVIGIILQQLDVDPDKVDFYQAEQSARDRLNRLGDK